MSERSILAEQSIIGSALLAPSVLSGIDLSPVEFSDENYREIYSAIQALTSEDQVVDLVTVTDYLDKRTGKNWLPVLGELASKTPSTATKNAQAYANVVREEARIRIAIDAGMELINTLKSERDLSAVDSAIKTLMAIDGVGKSYDHSAADMCKSAADELEKAFNAHMDGKPMGIPTGLKELDETLGGFHNSDLVVIPARPAMGKTALALNMALGGRAKCGIISSEQGHEQVGLRCISISGSVSSHKMRNGDLGDSDWSKIMAAVGNLKDRTIWVNDKATITIQEIQRKAREWKFKYGIEILFVDYIQRIKTTTQHMNKISQVEEVTTGLKNLAKELDIPVVALAQVNRECEKHENKRPNMGHVADASIIEKEADSMIVLYRDEVYNENSPDKGIAELGILKNRHGPTGCIRVAWRGEFLQFRNLAEAV